MTQIKTLLFFSILCVSHFAQAEYNPNKSSLDGRVRYQNYTANDVTKINAVDGYTTVIKFSENEVIGYVTTGFESGWEHRIEKNYLIILPKAVQQGSNYIQPASPIWDTNLVVITDKREYLFQLSLTENRQENTFILKFNYPTDVAKARQEQITQKNKYYAEIKNQAMVKQALGKLSPPANWDYYKSVNKNSQTIAPDFVYDDGVMTFLGFANNKEIPSVYLVNPDNSEEILTTNMRADVINNYRTMVVHGVSQRLMLRSGNKVVGILNKSFSKERNSQHKTTTSFSVIRVLNK